MNFTFILTMWDVNSLQIDYLQGIHTAFILTMWDVNLEFFTGKEKVKIDFYLNYVGCKYIL